LVLIFNILFDLLRRLGFFLVFVLGLLLLQAQSNHGQLLVHAKWQHDFEDVRVEAPDAQAAAEEDKGSN